MFLRSVLLARLRIAFGIALVALTACIPSNRAPSVTPRQTLSLSAEGKNADGPFAVVFARPQGKAPSSAAIQIVFSRALRELSEAGNEAPVPVRLTPALEGAWQWVGTNALFFVPKTGLLPGATQVTVEVPAGTRALDGSVLAKAYRFTFETPRPKLVRSEPSNEATDIEPPKTIELRFNQPIDAKELERAGHLIVDRPGQKTTVAFRARVADAKTPKHLIVEPLASLPAHSTIAFEMSKDLRGSEGPLASDEIQHVEFRTYGPLVVRGVSCDRATPANGCAPMRPVTLELSNPVRARDIKKAVSIEPPLRIQWDSSMSDDEVTSASIAAPFEPGRSYVIKVSASIADRYGQRLAAAASQKIQVDDFWPTVSIGLTGTYLEPALKRPLEVGSLNVSQFDLVVFPLKPEQVGELGPEQDPAGRFAKLDLLSGADRRVVRPRAPKNKMAREPISLGGLGPKGRGAIAVGARWQSSQYGHAQPQYDVRVLQVTDLGITAKLSRHGSLVWVTQLSTGTPVGGASVELRDHGKLLHAYSSDANGLAAIPSGDFAPNLESPEAATGVLVVKNGDDWAFRRVSDFIGPWRLNVPSDFSGSLRVIGMLLTDRGLYRPGDTVNVKGILRRETPTGSAVLVDTPLELVLTSPQGEEVSRARLRTSEHGTFSAAVRVPASGALGSWRLETDGLKGGSISESFEVAEYRPAEFRVTAEPSKPAFVRADSASWTIRADYLFGAPMGGAKIRYNLMRSATMYSPPGSDDYVTDASAYYADLDVASLAGGQLRSGETKLDAKGTLRVTEKLALPEQRGPEIVVLDAEVTDVSRQALSATTSVLVHPADFYVALRPPEASFVKSPGRIAIGVTTLLPDGKAAPGRNVTVQLLRRRWTIARQQAGTQTHTVATPVDEAKAKCAVTTREGSPVACELSVGESGYYIVRATAKDARGNATEAALGLYAVGEGGASWPDKDDATIDVVLDKKQYGVGDVARVLVKSPFKRAEALITVERAGVYKSIHRVVEGPTPVVEIPVTADLVPNAFIGVHLLRGRTRAPHGDGPDIGAPAYRFGYAELALETASHRLRVEVKPNATDFRPGAPVTVDVAVRDTQGKPHAAEVTLYAADEGTLTLVGYKTPDPIPALFAPRPLQVATLESRIALAQLELEDLGRGEGVDKGRDGGGGGESGSRRDFRQSIYFEPRLLTDPQGHARATFKLGESLTTYRIMAIAVAKDDHYGSGDARVTTSRKLMARPALPRFLRAGDRADVGVIVTTKDFGPTTAKVTAQFEGVSLDGAPSQSVRVDRNASVEVRFPIEAARATNAKLRFQVEGSGERDDVSVERRVDAPAVLEAVALYGSTRDRAGEKLGDLREIRSDVGGLEVTLAPTALVGLEGGVEQLVDYPYGCTEQLASRLVPLIPLRGLATDFALPLPPNIDSVIDHTVAAILARQHGDGGFGMWTESDESSSWVSAYAVWSLAQARAKGASVPKIAVDRGVAYLRRELAAEKRSSPGRDVIDDATAAFIVDVLADLKAPDPGYMTRLFEARSRLPLFARALLLHAFAVSKGDKKASDALINELENTIRVQADTAFVTENLGDEYAVLMDSPARTTALVLRALVAAKPDHRLAAPLARGLLAARQGGRWRSTQETAYALLALDAYRRAQERETPAFSAQAWFSGRQLFSQSFAGRSRLSARATVPLENLRGGGGLLAFVKDGTGTLFYSARLRYARRELPRLPLDRGFFIQKTLRAVTPDTLSAALESPLARNDTAIGAGALVLVDLIAVTPSPREYVVIDDPLPAGLEGVDARLATTARWLDVPESGDVGEPEGLEGDDAYAHGLQTIDVWNRHEVRDDRVLFFVDHMPQGMYRYRYLARATTPGMFVLPPTRAEAMYSPEIFGRTASASLEVRR